MYQSERGLPASNWHHAASLASAQTRAEPKVCLGVGTSRGLEQEISRQYFLKRGLHFCIICHQHLCCPHHYYCNFLSKGALNLSCNVGSLPKKANNFTTGVVEHGCLGPNARDPEMILVLSWVPGERPGKGGARWVLQEVPSAVFLTPPAMVGTNICRDNKWKFTLFWNLTLPGNMSAVHF